MSRDVKRNVGMSVKTRLLQFSKESQMDYMKILVRYLHERLLYRGTYYHEHLHLFDNEFATNPDRNKRWKAFLRKMRIADTIEFVDVMQVIKENLQPYWNEKLLSSETIGR